MKLCPHCKETKPRSEFYPLSKYNTYKLSAYCKPCDVQKAMKWQRDNREQSRQTRHEWDKRHREYRRVKEAERRARLKEEKKAGQ